MHIISFSHELIKFFINHMYTNKQLVQLFFFSFQVLYI